jgi:hypothetical protein
MAAPTRLSGGVGMTDTANPSFQSITMSQTGFVYESYADSLVAFAGGGQSGALLMTAECNRIATVTTAGDSVRLPASVPGLTVYLANHSATNPMQVYGSGADTINDVAAATGVSQMPNSVVLFTCYTAGAWYSEGLATGFSGGFQTLSAKDNITAYNGGGQANATLLTAMLNRIVTVANATDSLKLPVSSPGMAVTVTNASVSTQPVVVFPQAADQINALGISGSFSILNTKTCEFICHTAGQWHTLLSA